jgi:dihydroorotate dehydrogenase electron transfer subunit
MGVVKTASRVLSIKKAAQDIVYMAVSTTTTPKPGQFYLLRAWEEAPLLGRPISVFGSSEGQVEFVFKVVGKGTEILAKLKVGDELQLEGPYGNGFPEVEGRILLVGGGLGNAPLQGTARRLKAKGQRVDLRLGFAEDIYMKEAFESAADQTDFVVGGLVTDGLDLSDYDAVFTCGPHPMMEAVVKLAKAAGIPSYVSIEKRMACGIGACLVCTCKTKSGNKKTCKDGPVFEGEEVFYEDDHQIS